MRTRTKFTDTNLSELLCSEYSCGCGLIGGVIL